MKSLLLMLAVLTTPIQAQESLPQCQEVANTVTAELEAEGYKAVDVKQFSDALMFIFRTADELHSATVLIITAPQGYSLKGKAKLVKEGDCMLGDAAKAYWGVAKLSDPQARAEQ